MERIYMDDFPGTKYRVNLIKESSESSEWQPLSSPRDAYDYLKSLQYKDREYFVAIFLTTKNPKGTKKRKMIMGSGEDTRRAA